MNLRVICLSQFLGTQVEVGTPPWEWGPTIKPGPIQPTQVLASFALPFLSHGQTSPWSDFSLHSYSVQSNTFIYCPHY